MRKPGTKNNKIKHPEGWRFDFVTSVEEIEAIRPIWNQMQNTESSPAVNADIDRYLTIIEAMNGAVQPYIMILFHNDNPTSMVVAWIEINKLRLKLGYKTLMNPKLKCLSVVYGGILGEKSDDICNFLIRGLIEQLRSGKVSMIYFNHLRTDSQIYTLSKKLPGIFGRGYFPKIESHWIIFVPETIELFYQSCSASSRKQYKKCVRRLEKNFPGKVRIVTYSQENNLDEAIRYASHVSAKTYQHSIGCGFVDNPFTRALLKNAAQNGWLRIHIMFINDEPCAYEVWVRYGKAYHGHGIGFDPKWQKWRIGTVLFQKTLESVCDDPDVERIDFGFGDADYKRSYGDKEWKEASVYIFAPRFYPILVNMLRTSMMVLNSVFEYFLRKTGLENKIKSYWRKRLAQKAS